MKGAHLFRQAFNAFFKHWGAYTILILFMNILLAELIIPIMTWLASLILKYNRIPFISYTNIGRIFTSKPQALLELIILLLLVLTLVFYQFMFTFQGIEKIRINQRQNLFVLARDSFINLKNLRPSTFLFFIFYFILVLPFARIILNSPLLAKVRIPEFIETFLYAQPLYAVLMTLFYIGLAYVGLRLIQVLPLMILHQRPAFTAVKRSWQLTRRNTWRYLWRLLALSVLSTLFILGFTLLIYLLQLYLDQQHAQIAFAGAVLNMGLVNIWQKFIGAFTLVMVSLILILALNRQTNGSRPVLPPSQPVKLKHWLRIGASLFVSLYLSINILFNIFYLQGVVLQPPLTISHRGVDDENGVQNTIPALLKTSREKPDYVEMDIHETKDHQFVVMHDENLKALAGIDKAPYQLTLAQLKQITVRENGHQAKIASFDDYLAAAQQHHQKLLVEIKTTPHDSTGMLTNFIQKYETTLLKHHDRIHSLDYSVVQGLKRRAPKLFVSYILPYNLSFPQTKANAYTMEETTLNEQFVKAAHQRQQEVYAWTVNDDTEMTRMLFLNVDGIITDNLHTLKATIKTDTRHPSYAQLLLIYINELQVVNDPTGTPEN
ncbi:glycerophosphoryl diester phosphodiesterase membrane domain-containing protein [Agrilactobacillus fermenti]|uniref:glycerophosphoryl diester phosphodiesterase membrane domain-containing protein n=1 Tax=Agrilactobacillus fermenti TaxID=2586909 RepID=UPI003A5C4A70